MTLPSHDRTHREHNDAPTQEESDPVFLWDIKTHTEREHGNLFYFSILAAMALLLMFAIWQNNFLFGVFVIVATGTVLYLSTRRAPVIKFICTEHELIIGDEARYPYNHLAYFDVYSFSPDDIELFFVFKKRARTMLRIPIWRGDKDKLVAFMQTKVPQHPIEPSLLDILSKIVGI
ncbi:MAG: hypothetical protein WC246_02045 [Candidatus Paceibacterota bacterium]|jgi:hypothetical protein